MQNMQLDKARMNAFEQYLKEEEKQQATIEKYIRDVLGFLTFCKGMEITKERVIAYKAELIEDLSRVFFQSDTNS